jgi:hypothetical protein
MNDEKRNGAAKRAAYPWEQPENGVPPKADIGARDYELLIHDSG